MLSAIRAARQRLSPYLSPTPLVRRDALSRRLGASVHCKLETLQPTGAFKVRPAFNSVLAGLDAARSNGVVTSSSGNFAQAVAYAARELDVHARIVMMSSASAFKRDRTRALGAEVVDCAANFEARLQTVQRIHAETGALVLSAYNSPETVTGDGTLGLELLDQLPEAFCVVVPMSGGGLISGIATAVKELRPGCRVIGVQAAASPAWRVALDAGEIVTTSPNPSLADALQVAAPGDLTFPIVQRWVDDVVLVSEDEIEAAVRWLAVEEKLVVEGGGAVGVAAALAGRIDRQGLDLVFVLSGGNILPSALARILTT
ncbi:MAG: pyridoxal-phosphate dependent enzyme [Acidobacteria bacterium]|nr:pyridoxal-phosphate dependent enzyme [Acidobacteriota bacterium]